MIHESEIVAALTPFNGGFFSIPDLNDYAWKIVTQGKCVNLRQGESAALKSFILYYDNGPELFISMVWTRPELQGQGHARRLLQQLIRSSHKDIRLEVHEANPALRLYKRIGFVLTEKTGSMLAMRFNQRMAIMQPYVFPYIGYFQLIHASSRFVFYDDVNYITRGWINRNRILQGGREHTFTVPVSGASQNRAIDSIGLAIDDVWREKFMRTIDQAYRRAPHYADVRALILSVFFRSHRTISELAIDSIVQTCAYLNQDLNHTKSSTCAPDSRGLGRADRLIEITRQQGYTRYVNAAGGKALYTKDYFREQGIELEFIESEPIHYLQNGHEFVAGLSIIDVLMFNSPSVVAEMLRNYKLL